MNIKKTLSFILTLSLLLSVITPKLIFAEDSKLTYFDVSANNFLSGPNFNTKLENVYDGNDSTTANYAARKGATAYENNPNFLFNLGTVCNITKYVIVFPNSTRINHYELYISTDDITYTKIDEFKGSAYTNEGKFEVIRSFSAQYLKLVATGAYNNGTTLNENYILSEFAVYGTAREEVTSRKLSIKSGVMAGFSVTSPVEGTTIERAFDGNQSNFVKVIGNPLGDNAHFTFDLGEAYKLNNLVINFGSTRDHFYKILVSIDGEDFAEVKAYTSGIYGKTDGYYVKEESLNGVVARYVRVVAYGTEASPANQYYTINEISVFGEDLLIHEDQCEYAGSQIRTVLVPYFREGSPVDDEYRQGLRFCFKNLPELNSTITLGGRNYTVSKQSALVILKSNLSDNGELTINNTAIRNKTQILESLLDYSDESGTYKSVYIYNIPVENVNTTIVVRVFFECTDDDGKVIYLYSETKEDSLTSVYNRMNAAQKGTLSPDAAAWFE